MYCNALKRSAVAILLILCWINPAQAASDDKPRERTGGATLGLALGGGLGSVDDKACQAGRDCEGTGTLFLLSGRFNLFAGPVTLGVRYVADMDDESEATEFAGLIGIRAGRSPVSLMIGPGSIREANSRAEQKVSVLSWEILIAPKGRNVQYAIHGAQGGVDYAAFSFVVTFGKQ